MRITTHFTKKSNATTIYTGWTLIKNPSGWISTNDICGALHNKYTFDRIPNRNRHKIKLHINGCDLLKFLLKKNIVKKL